MELRKDTCPDENALAEFVEDMLGDEARAQIEAHLDACASCREAIASVLRVASRFSGVIPSQPRNADSDRRREEFGGRYVPERLLGVGGMGMVYAGRDTELARPVAIKVLHDVAPELHTRMQDEAQILARLSHPHIVQIYDIEVTDARAAIVMERICGDTLDVWLAQRRRSAQTIVHLLAAVARALGAAHAAGVVHGDVTPRNIMVAEDDRPRLLDFGLASAACPKFATTGDAPSGRCAGTPGYIPPEARTGRSASAVGDQYSLCVTADEALNGVRPKVVPGVMDAPSDADVWLPRPLRAVLSRGLNPSPQHRFPSMHALADALEHSMAERRPVRVAWAALCFALVVPFAASQTSAASRCASLGDAFESEAAATQVRSRLLELDPTGRLHREFDRHAAEIALAGDASCQRTSSSSPVVHDAVMTCVHIQKARLGALVDALRDPHHPLDAERVMKALEHLSDECEAGEGLPLPADGKTRRRVLAALQQLEAVEIDLLTDALGSANDRMLVVQEAATRERNPVLDAKLHFTRGLLHRAQSRYEEAQAEFLSAFEGAAANGLDALAFVAWSRYVLVTQHDLMDRSQDEPLRRTAEAYLLRLGTSSRAQHRGKHHETLGIIASAWGQHEQAVSHLQSAHAALMAGRGAASLYEAGLLNSLAVARARAHDNVGSTAAFERALAIYEKRLGPHARQVAMVLSNLVHGDIWSGRTRRAIARAERALAILQARSPIDEDSVMSTRAMLGLALQYDDRPSEALPHLEAVARFRAQKLGETHPATIDAERGLADLLIELGRARDALALLQRTLAKFEHSDVSAGLQAMTWLEAGNASLTIGDADEALAQCRRGTELLEAQQAEPYLGETRVCRARAHAALGRHFRAVSLYEEALSPGFRTKASAPRVAVLEAELAEARASEQR